MAHLNRNAKRRRRTTNDQDIYEVPSSDSDPEYFPPSLKSPRKNLAELASHYAESEDMEAQSTTQKKVLVRKRNISGPAKAMMNLGDTSNRKERWNPIKVAAGGSEVDLDESDTSDEDLGTDDSDMVRQPTRKRNASQLSDVSGQNLSISESYQPKHPSHTIINETSSLPASTSVDDTGFVERPISMADPATVTNQGAPPQISLVSPAPQTNSDGVPPEQMGEELLNNLWPASENDSHPTLKNEEASPQPRKEHRISQIDGANTNTKQQTLFHQTLLSKRDFNMWCRIRRAFPKDTTIEWDNCALSKVTLAEVLQEVLIPCVTIPDLMSINFTLESAKSEVFYRVEPANDKQFDAMKRELIRAIKRDIKRGITDFRVEIEPILHAGTSCAPIEMSDDEDDILIEI
ncbi:hypothetical protein ACLMJK_003010 [Lecanora helva]